MRTVLKFLTGISLLAATGFLASDVLFDVSTPLSRPSLLVTTIALVVFARQLRSTREKLFQRAIDTYVQRESLREMEVALQRERDKQPARPASDSQAMQNIAS